MRLHLMFAVLAVALVAVTAWILWDDAFPEWRVHQRVLARRQIARLETELRAARSALDRPENRYELARLDRAIAAAAADTSAPVARLGRIRARLDGLDTETQTIRAAIREGDRRLREPATAQRRSDLTKELERIQQTFARATGIWPPDTLRLRRLWAMRDSLAGVLIRIEGPVQLLRDSLLAKESAAQQLRIDAILLASTRDSLVKVRVRMLEPVTLRVAALARLRRQTPRIREIASRDGKEVARCPTCHGAMDDGPGVHPALPAMEVFRDVPCTICHHGRGRALAMKEAHRGLLTAGDFSEGPYSIRARIERLQSRDPAERERAREELWKITGVDAASGRSGGVDAANPDSAAAVSWTEWWRTAEPYFEPGEGQAEDRDNKELIAAGIDPWLFSTRGRPLRYVGSQRCLACHEIQHREHSRRWMPTKFRSIERLVGEPRPERCFPCHTTGYDPATGAYAEPGVTCEGCHGPGERYNEMMVVGQELIGKGDQVRGRALLDLSSRLSREAVNLRMVTGDRGEVNVCVSCHHPWEHRDGGPAALELPVPVMTGGAGRAPGRPLRGG